MLNVNEIAARIENPSITQAEDAEDLKILSEKYPYTQLFSILYLQSLKQAGDVHFEDELKKHSFRITDRAQLFNLIESTHSVSSEPTEIISSQEQVEIEETVFVANEAESEMEDEPIKVDSSKTEEDGRILESESSETASQTQEVYSIKEAFKNDPALDKDEDDPLEQTIAHHIYAANYTLESLTPEEERKLQEREAENQKSTVSEEISSETSKELSFTSWLQANDNHTEPEEELISAKVVTKFSNLDPSSNPLFGELERPKTEFFSAPKKAKKSLTEETIPVSETLAKIYEMQGNYPKAIVAYEQLMLTIPEKKSFFASLIKELKTKLNT